jgi:MraZ protein
MGRGEGLAVAALQFISRYRNKIDRKGRVSVPATFRAALSGGGSNLPPIICFPSHLFPCVEGMAHSELEKMIADADGKPKFSRERRMLEGLFSRMSELPFDSEGRVMLPDNLTRHAGITDTAMFVGCGSTFQIWEPERFNLRDAELDAELAERARREEAMDASNPSGAP